ncbi:hypothetical protein [Ornithinibacillus californiensis]|uniref:hypothetical protein n=1 Tax=Ornithinibacillus californiensis TaxID=161536 RepID=UPI00064DBF28|nr:hypothetical protein [Ornithinibacillus californiensis]
MTKKKQILIVLTLVIITIYLFLFTVDGNEKNMLISEDLLNASEIEYLELVGIEDDTIIKINESDNMKKIIPLLQQLNGSLEESLPSNDESLLGIRIALKGHYPSSVIVVYQDKMFFQGEGRNVSGELVNKFVKTLEGSF